MSEVMDAMRRVAARSRQRYPIDEKDYIKNGLVYCFKCNEPKQVRLSDDLIVNIACRCQKEADMRLEDDREAILHAQRVQNLRSASIPARYHDWTLANMYNTDEKMVKFVKSYVAKFDSICEKGLNICLRDKRGTGKTYFTAAIANALVEEEKPVKFMTFSEFLNIAKEPFAEVKREMMQKVTKPKLLIIDGFAIADWMESKLLDAYQERFGGEAGDRKTDAYEYLDWYAADAVRQLQ
jgi:DNA replication protein